MFGGNLYDAISVICKKPLAIKVPASSGAGILNLSKIIIKTVEITIRINKS